MMGECFKFGRGKVELYDPVFANNSWEKIISACQSGKVPDAWQVGDQKVMTINGYDYPIDIIGKNHDTYSDGSGTAPLTLQMHDCYNTAYPMNSSRTNSGGWNASVMRNTTLPAILSLMPTEVQSGIRTVNKKATTTYSSSTMTTTADKLFLLADIEVFGSATATFSGEGTQYTYYKNGNSKVKGFFNGISIQYDGWWLRSANKTHSQEFCYIHSADKAFASTYYANNSLYVAFAFCF